MVSFPRGRVAVGPLRLLGPLVLALLLGATPPLTAQVTPDQAAEMLLNSARKAYNERNYPFAVARFREFLAKFGNHKDAASAHYGLALSVLESPEKDYKTVVAELQPLAGRKELPEHPFVLYYLGQAQRGLGTRELAEARAKPQEAKQRQAQANQHFEEAARQFAAAEAAFGAKVPQVPADVKDLPEDLEWAARARCDLAEMQLRAVKAKEAQATAAPFVKEARWAKSRYRPLGLYYHGFASFLLDDHLTAGKSLNQLTPLNDPVFGPHARYLLARTHHLADERAEAAGHYEGVLAEYDRQKKAAAEALKRPDQFKNNPDEKARLERLVQEPPADYVARAAFFSGVLRYEDGKFGEALARFADFAKTYPNSPLIPEAQLRQGFCQVQLKQFKEAAAVLQPLADKEPRLADQAIFWLGKAQAGGADPANPQAQEAALKAAVETIRRAVDRAQQLTASDPDAKGRRAEMLLELADTQQLAKQFKEAAATYGQLLAEKALPQREEELLLRQLTAQHLAGDYTGSDQLCVRFLQSFPKSTLLPPVLFRHAENAHFQAVAAEKAPNRAAEVPGLRDEVIKRYQAVVEKYPDFPQVSLARYGLGLALFRKGETDKAKAVLDAIPQADRGGELSVVSYLLADCLIRQAPAKVDDALAAGKAQEQLQAAVGLLDTFLGAQPAAPQSPDALIKLGHCHQRLAALLAQPPERAKVLASARAAYERLIQQFPNHALRPQAGFERAKVLAQAGDVNGGLNELKRFEQDPLRASPVAPLALLHLATLLRGQNKPADAAVALAQCRQQHEQALLRDPTRAEWVPLLQYHHGLALREAGKLPEARAVFDQVVKQFAQRPEAAEAALRLGQCLREEGSQKVATARKTLATPNLPPAQAGPANQALAEGLRQVQEAVQLLDNQVKQLKEKQPTWEVRARMLYDGAWCNRILAEAELAAARDKMQQEELKKLQAEAAKKAAPGSTPAAVAPPEVPLAKVPLQPAEKKARELYQELLLNFADLPLAVEARFELAELLAQRTEYDAATKLLSDALDKEPNQELTDKIRLRIGDCALSKGDVKEALTQFEAVAQNPKSPLAGQARYRAGECLMQLKDFGRAVPHFAAFRDQGPFQNLPGLTDRALLRLGHAHAELKQWDQSRQAFDLLVGRFGASPWLHDARYGAGWAWQNLNQFDNAVGAYSQVTAGTATETAAKAQLQIGLCRLAQKRYAEAANALLVVPFTYDYPELSAVALCEAGRTFTELKQPEQAAKLYQRVIKDHPRSQWAEVARQRLANGN